MIGRIVVALFLFIAKHDPVSARWDNRAASCAIAAIRFYQRYLSRASGRSCLFKVTCSSRALAAFERDGWRIGLRITAAQIGRCGGEFTLLRTVQGETVLVSNDGLRFGPNELSDQLCGTAP